MCEFVDKDGNPLEIGDQIEYWGVEKEWILAKVITVETVRKLVRMRNDEDKWAYLPESRTKILVEVDRNNPTRSQYYASRVKLSKSANIRKVI